MTRGGCVIASFVLPRISVAAETLRIGADGRDGGNDVGFGLDRHEQVDVGLTVLVGVGRRGRQRRRRRVPPVACFTSKCTCSASRAIGWSLQRHERRAYGSRRGAVGERGARLGADRDGRNAEIDATGLRLRADCRRQESNRAVSRRPWRGRSLGTTTRQSPRTPAWSR